MWEKLDNQFHQTYEERELGIMVEKTEEAWLILRRKADGRYHYDKFAKDFESILDFLKCYGCSDESIYVLTVTLTLQNLIP